MNPGGKREGAQKQEIFLVIWLFKVEPKAIKEKLKCHDFDWFVEKFKGIAPCDARNTRLIK